MPIYDPGPPFEWTSDFGDMRDDGPHGGTDFKAPLGTPIPCAAQGVVVGRGWRSDYGYMTIVQHDVPTTRQDEYTLYAHQLGTCYIPAIGTPVARGQAIGRVGNTGNSSKPHLHIELIWSTANRWLSVDNPWEEGIMGLVADDVLMGRLDPRLEGNWYGMDVYQAAEGASAVAPPSLSCSAPVYGYYP